MFVDEERYKASEVFWKTTDILAFIIFACFDWRGPLQGEQQNVSLALIRDKRWYHLQWTGLDWTGQEWSDHLTTLSSDQRPIAIIKGNSSGSWEVKNINLLSFQSSPVGCACPLYVREMCQCVALEGLSRHFYQEESQSIPAPAPHTQLIGPVTRLRRDGTSDCQTQPNSTQLSLISFIHSGSFRSQFLFHLSCDTWLNRTDHWPPTLVSRSFHIHLLLIDKEKVAAAAVVEVVSMRLEYFLYFINVIHAHVSLSIPSHPCNWPLSHRTARVSSHIQPASYHKGEKE